MLEHPERFSYDDVKAILSAIPNDEHKALSCLAYATGSRVSELIRITPDDFFYEPTGRYLFITCKVLKKRKGLGRRTAVVRLDEDWLIKPIEDWKATILDKNTPLFPLNRVTIYRRLVKATGWNPHGFRKLRATHLRLKFGFDAYQLMKFFGWKDISPSGYYVGLDPKEIQY